ncbi:PREDICTED: uncharacterized protein LOC109581312 [Amphimedon queenslandica]|uniref:Hemicentin-1-like von Willebrand factor A domain-containing protein n=1 Tax=Amphimedon queenslandica TaxID=400682 RepID=A0A1X7V351_AMPQE|nr:PREDICTED: uncharacterized protein LOC109581312 [Amphimedon queenslandica]|eukprot:XP_019850898.1 PREDICTED: uncharacterized protein LOC109581312 [Amphimedon queenslandica]
MNVIQYLIHHPRGMDAKAFLFFLSFVSLVSFSTSSTCFVNEINNYFKQRDNASQDVLALVNSNFIAAVGSNTTNINGSYSTEALYSAIANASNVTKSEKGMKNFNNALNEITNSYFVACEGSDQQFDNTMNTLKQFLEHVMNFTDGKSVREDYGKLLCSQKQSGRILDVSKSTNKQRRSTSTSVLDCASSPTIQELQDCLDPFDVWPCIFNIDPTRGDCPQSTTQTQARNCLAFVVDTTGSMADEIAAARQIIRQFIQSEENILTFCYVLVAFNDYNAPGYVSNLEFYKIYDAHYTSNDPNSQIGFSVNKGGTPVYGTDVLLTDVDSLGAHGGNDCPEYGMIGILKAIELINSIDNPYIKEAGKHNVIVLTDASAADDELYPYVIGNATIPDGLDITVHFFYSNENGCTHPASIVYGYGNYPAISNATCGFAVHSITTQAFKQFASYLYKAQQDAGYGLDTCVAGSQAAQSNPSIINPQNVSSNNCAHFNISVLAGSFAVLLQGSTLNPVLTVTFPNGTVESISVQGDFTVYQQNHPLQGQWNMCLSAGDVIDFSLSVDMDIEIDVNYVVSDEQAQKLHPTSDPPYSCDTVSVILQTAQLAKIDFNKSLSLELVHVNGTIEGEKAELSKCSDAIIGSFTVPKTASPLFYQVEGTDIGGIKFKEIISSKTVSFPKSDVSLMPLIDSESVLLSPDGETVFEYQYSLLTERIQPVPLLTQWILQSNNVSLRQSLPTKSSIRNSQHAHIKFDNLNDLLNTTGQEINWTLIATDECNNNKEHTFSAPVTVLPPLDLSTSISCTADVNVDWNSLSNDTGLDLHYNASLEYNNGTTVQHTYLSQPGLVISDLLFNETLQVRISAGYQSGKIIYKEPYDIRNNADVPSPPKSLMGRDITPNFNTYTVELEWLPPDCLNSKNSINYTIYHKEEQQQNWINTTVTVEEGGQGTTGLIIKNIEVSGPGNHLFKISGINEAGLSIESNEANVTVSAIDNDQGESTVVIVTVLVPVCIIIALGTVGTLIAFGAIYFKRQSKRKRMEEADYQFEEYNKNDFHDNENEYLDEDKIHLYSDPEKEAMTSAEQKEWKVERPQFYY